MLAGSFCSGTDFEIHMLFENWMVAGSFCSGKAFSSSKINVCFKNWLVAGSCCSSNGSKYKDALKIGW
jgi:hypothetical protein